MDVKLEQQANIKFCIKFGKSGVETFEMLWRAYGNEATCRATCFKWHAHFKTGRTSLEDDERSGRTSTSSTPTNVETVRWLVHEDHKLTIKDIAAISNVSYGMFFAVWGRAFGKNDLNSGVRAIGCSMMTMHPLTELS
jgi:hypothetical protein